MKSGIKFIVLFVFLSLVAGCSKDFLSENLTQVPLPMGLSNIYLSPGWPEYSYMFKLPSVKEADYEIVSKPDWLNIDSFKGHLSDSIAIIQCSAEKIADFNPVGIYMDFMTVTADGKNYKIPVAYITEGNPSLQVQSSLSISNNSGRYLNLTIRNAGIGILLWEITSMPDWLVLDTARVKSTGIYIPSNTSYNIPLFFVPGNAVSGNLSGTIVLSTNDSEHPEVVINVTVDLGTPQLYIYTNSISFSYSEASKTITFTNYGNGTLVWEFKEIPGWLSIAPSSGMLNSGLSSGNIVFSCDRTKLSPGQNTAIVNLKTNDTSKPSYSITVTAIAPGSNGNIRTVSGNITDAVFNKNSNVLYFVTSTPNKFVTYDMTGRTVLNEISLSKAPTCFAISEDWTKAAVGHNGFISAIDLTSKTVTATYTVDYSVNDIAWAENNWFCCTQNGGNFAGLHWINTANDSSYNDTDTYSLDGNSIIKKVPNKPYLIATRRNSSPNGFFAYDIATKSKKSYSHMSLGNFWFSEDGDYVFAGTLDIYRTTSSTGSTDTFNATINSIGKISIGTENYYGLQYLYHSGSYLWIIRNDSYTSDASASSSMYQVEDNDYTLVKNIAYGQQFMPEGQTTSFNVRANYVFANKDETEIAVLCKGIGNNNWIIQFIPVK